MEYRDPATGGPVVPALGCYLQMLRPGVRTRAHRETSSAVYHVVGGRRLHGRRRQPRRVGRGRLLRGAARVRCTPTATPASEPAILYSVQDVPLLKALGFYRVET